MSISNLMQHSVESPSLPYRLAPCAKAISVLFLVFSSPMVWADIHDKSQQRVEQQSSLYPSPVEQNQAHMSILGMNPIRRGWLIQEKMKS